MGKSKWVKIDRLATKHQIAPIRLWIMIRQRLLPYRVERAGGTFVDEEVFDEFVKSNPSTVKFWREALAHRKEHYA